MCTGRVCQAFFLFDFTLESDKNDPYVPRKMKHENDEEKNS